MVNKDDETDNLKNELEQSKDCIRKLEEDLSYVTGELQDERQKKADRAEHLMLVIPFSLVTLVGMLADWRWYVYLPVLCVAMLLSVLVNILWGDRYR